MGGVAMVAIGLLSAGSAAADDIQSVEPTAQSSGSAFTVPDPLPDAAGQPAQVSAAIRVGRIPGRTRVVVDLSDKAQYLIFSLDSPDRVVIDLKNTQLQALPPAGLFVGTPIASMHSGIRNESDLRLVLDLKHTRLRREDFVLRPDAHGGHRLVLDLYEEYDEPSVLEQPAVAAVAVSSAPAEPSTNVVGHSREPLTSVVKSAVSPRADAQPSSGARDIWTGGYGEIGAAYTVAGSSHWSQLRARLELGASGSLDWGARFRIVARAEGDGAYDIEDDFYPDAVRRNQRSDFALREAYLDMNAGDWEYRLGRQQVVWGEMVGFFLADVVSARDTREFYLPEFETMRIPQWAVRVERFAGDSHFELLWIPYTSYDEVGKPGADFYPYPVATDVSVNEVTPSRSKLSNTNMGARYSRLISGWDLTAFYYQSNDVNPTLYRTDSGLELRHDRIQQVGTTFSKDYLDFVLKGEAVYTSGRGFLSTDPTARFGLHDSDVVDYIVGAMIPRGDWRFDAQVYGRTVFDHDSGLLFDENEFGITLLANRRFGDRFEVEILYLAGLNRTDYSVQSSVNWNITQTWRLQFGADLFGGSELGFFGRFEDSDRVFVALKKWF